MLVGVRGFMVMCCVIACGCACARSFELSVLVLASGSLAAEFPQVANVVFDFAGFPIGPNRLCTSDVGFADRVVDLLIQTQEQSYQLLSGW